MTAEGACVLKLRALLCVSLLTEIDRTTEREYHNLIEQYLKDFDALYCAQQRLPKHHFALHFCTQLSSLGPLRFSNCLPFEKKHSFFKTHTYRNLKNLPKSLSIRHQNWIAKNMLTPENMASENYLYVGHILEERDCSYHQSKEDSFAYFFITKALLRNHLED
ncbi:unnamed protein product [Didymodactylos carnosus]|uniref:Uncharacterized protein n=1 Tax=Didymodactylos carnosus TaxID=1234261 RepID=A0A815G000_9BILA|nr:unnamed protein product [Didymodactylos carnosus]CAF1332354.1 unnamed protein product [Didymodactylos carnosus]CAF3774651.1 unnamed protein product [Didymodactylos carnosus]CAF4187106.1 unnamed protein product [Didymodactylos carnosus]